MGLKIPEEKNDILISFTSYREGITIVRRKGRRFWLANTSVSPPIERESQL